MSKIPASTISGTNTEIMGTQIISKKQSIRPNKNSWNQIANQFHKRQNDLPIFLVDEFFVLLDFFKFSDPLWISTTTYHQPRMVQCPTVYCQALHVCLREPWGAQPLD